MNRPKETIPFPNDHRYGYISKNESLLVDDMVVRLKNEFGFVRFLEIGVFGGCTMLGLCEKAEEIGCPIQCEGVDIGPAPSFCPDGYIYHKGDSMDEWRNISGTFNFLWVDGCHCSNHSMMDFLNYSPFVVVGGYCLFHDTSSDGGKIDQSTFPQDHSYAGKPPSVLGVRSGINKIGLLHGHRDDWTLIKEISSGDTMGMMVFKKIKPL